MGLPSHNLGSALQHDQQLFGVQLLLVDWRLDLLDLGVDALLDGDCLDFLGADALLDLLHVLDADGDCLTFLGADALLDDRRLEAHGDNLMT